MEEPELCDLIEDILFAYGFEDNALDDETAHKEACKLVRDYLKFKGLP